MTKERGGPFSQYSPTSQVGFITPPGSFFHHVGQRQFIAGLAANAPIFLQTFVNSHFYVLRWNAELCFKALENQPDQGLFRFLGPSLEQADLDDGVACTAVRWIHKILMVECDEAVKSLVREQSQCRGYAAVQGIRNRLFPSGEVFPQ